MFYNADVSPNNGSIHNVAQIIKAVMSSAAEAKLGAVFSNARETVHHGGFGCTIRSVSLRWPVIGFRAFDKLFYNRNSKYKILRDPTEIERIFARRSLVAARSKVRAF